MEHYRFETTLGTWFEIRRDWNVEEYRDMVTIWKPINTIPNCQTGMMYTFDVMFREYSSKSDWVCRKINIVQTCNPQPMSPYSVQNTANMNTIGALTKRTGANLDTKDLNNRCDCPLHGPDGVFAIGCRKGHK